MATSLPSRVGVNHPAPRRPTLEGHMSAHRTHTVAALLFIPLGLACRDKQPPAGADHTTAPLVSASVSESRTDSGTSSALAKDAPVSYVQAEQAFHRASYGEATQLFESYRRQHPDNPWGH